MSTNIAKRSVARLDSPAIQRATTENHRVRLLVPPGDWAATDPFLLLAEDWFVEGVFDRHPHRGFETVTYVIEGAIEHYDNHGNKGLLLPGEALWLTAGRGLIHNEVPAEGKPAHILQLWINLKRADKFRTARYQEMHLATTPVREEPGVQFRVFSGRSGSAIAPTHNYTPVTMVEVRLAPLASAAQEIPAGFNAFVVALSGSGTMGSSFTAVKAGHVAWLTQSEEESIVGFTAGAEELRVLLFAGWPLHEPVAAHGPFVMNTEEEVDAAYADYRREGEWFGRTWASWLP